MAWNGCFVFMSSIWLVNSMESYYQPSRGSSVWGYFTPPLVQREPQQSRQTPLEAMVDLTNNLGIAILQDHTFSRGNFAFSPYGVASVLVVLYEGARGESARQIHRAVGFPYDKDLIRIGFRDIHRHLRSYFSHEGYLSGISLNKETSSLKPEYKKVLRFYGYDVELNQPLDEDDDDLGFERPTSPANDKIGNKTTASTTLPPVTCPSQTTSSQDQDKNVPKPKPTVMESDKTNKTVSPTEEELKPGQNSTKPEETTKKPPTEDIKPVQNTTERDSEVMMETIPPTTTLAVNEHANKEEMGEEKEEDKRESTTTEKMKTTVEEKPTTVLANVNMSTTVKNDSNSTKQGEVTEGGLLGMEDSTTEKSEQSTNVPNANKEQQEMMSGPTTDPMVNNEMESEAPIATEAVMTTESNQIKETTNLDNGMLIPQSEDLVTAGTTETVPMGTESQTTDDMYYETESTTENFEETTEDEFQGKNVIRMSGKRLDPIDKKKIRSIIDAKVARWLAYRPVKPKRRRPRTITDYLKSPHSPDLSLQLQNGMYDTHVSRNANLYRSLPRLLFLVDGSVDTPVPMMTYTNVFPFAYIPKLHAKALEFPLDDIRYKLVILLPVERRGLRQLIYDLLDYPLRNVLQAMKPARVKAIVPTFMVEGFVILTSSLQKLGIWDVFDPRKANLSGMSMDPELYVRNVEQSVTVVIRNYVEILDIQTRTMAARYLDHEFEATHPFLYFVLDTATNVALMAGQILDPLNSRIY